RGIDTVTAHRSARCGRRLPAPASFCIGIRRASVKPQQGHSFDDQESDRAIQPDRKHRVDPHVSLLLGIYTRRVSTVRHIVARENIATMPISVDQAPATIGAVSSPPKKMMI